MGQKVIIFGATGMVGKELVYELLEDPGVDNVLAMVRRKLPMSNSRLEQLVMDDFVKLIPDEAKFKADTCFCCVGTTMRKAGTQEAFRKVDYDIPVAIARWANILQIPNLVIISSVSANAGSGNFYLRTKGQMEEQVKSSYKGNLKIIRPSIIFGHRDEFRLGEKIGAKIMTVLGFGMFGPLAKFKGLHSWDIARGMIQSVDLPKEKIIVGSSELYQLAVKGKKLKNKTKPSPGMI